MTANIPGIVRVLASGGERVGMAIMNIRIVCNHAKQDVTAAKGKPFGPTWQGTDRLGYQHEYCLPYFVLVLNGLYNYPCTCPFETSCLCCLRYRDRPPIRANAWRGIARKSCRVHIDLYGQSCISYLRYIKV
jgi:hypothetical protein